MKKRTWFSKVMAIVCAITVITSSMGLQILAAANATSQTTGGTYTPLGVEDFFGVQEHTVQSVNGAAGTSGHKAGEGYLDGILIDGIYHLSGNVVIDMGGNWKGLQISRIATDTLRYELVGSGTYETVTTTEAGCALFDEDVRISVGFSFIKEDTQAGTVDVVAVIKIGTTYMDVLTAKGLSKSAFQKYVYLYAQDKGSYTNSFVTWKATEDTPELPMVQEDSGYAPMTFADFGITEDYTVSGEGVGVSGGTGRLGGFMLDGTYCLFGNAIVDIGGRWNGLQISRTATDTLRYELVGSGTHTTVTEEQAGCALFDEDVRIKVGFMFLNENTQAKTADVVVVIKIGTTYTDVLTYKGASTDRYQKYMYLYAVDNANFTGSSLTCRVIKEDTPEPETPVIPEDSEYTPMTFADFGITQDYTVEGGTGDAKGGTGTLNGMMIDGTYRLSGNTIIDMGGRWNGFQISRTAEDTLRYEIIGSGTHKTVTEEQADCTLFDEDVRIRVGFSFANEDTEAKTADVTVVIKIGETYADVLTMEGASTTHFQKYMYLYAVDNANFTGSSVTLKVAEGSQEPPVIPADSEYTPMTFADFEVKGDYKVKGEGAGVSAGAGTLNGMMIDGVYHLSGNTIIDMGGQWKGFQISRTGEDTLRYEIVGSGTHKTVTEEQADCTLFDEDVRIRVGFSFANENTEAKTADVTVVIKIGETYADVVTAEGISTVGFQRYIYLYAVDNANYTDSSVILRGIKEAPDEMDSMKISYATPMTFFDFGVTEDYTIDGENVELMAGSGTLNGVIIDGIYSLSGNTIIDFGARWKGLQIQRQGTDRLRYQFLDTNGEGKEYSAYSKDVTSEDTGCALFDEDVQIKVGFTFVNEDTEAGITDVMIEVNIGSTYRDVFVVTGVKMANLRTMMFLYAADGNGYTGSKLTLRKPYMEPFDFREFGFTENWKVELKLKEK